jgi:hypothetical protein
MKEGNLTEKECQKMVGRFDQVMTFSYHQMMSFLGLSLDESSFADEVELHAQEKALEKKETRSLQSSGEAEKLQKSLNVSEARSLRKLENE